MIADFRPRHAAPFALVVWAAAALGAAAQVQIPEGFTPISNGRNLDGWHPSRASAGTRPTAPGDDTTARPGRTLPTSNRAGSLLLESVVIVVTVVPSRVW